MERLPHEGGELHATPRPIPRDESHDERVIREGITAAGADERPIDDYTARYIASQLHGGQLSALYSLASTGNIDPGVFAELSADRETFEPQVRGWVDALGTYCQARPDKGPVAGWFERSADWERDNEAAPENLRQRTSAAGAASVGRAAVARSREPGEPADQDDEHDDFSWGDAAHWSPVEVATSQIDENHYTSEELDELFGEQADEEVGSVDELGWYGLAGHEGRPGGLILRQDEQGFRHVREAETDEALAHEWAAIQHEYETFYEEREAYERATENAEDESNPGPRIWVASLADYSAGRLYGAWMDATLEAEQLGAATRFMLRGSEEHGAEEWGIFDHDGFEGYEVGEYESFTTISRIAKGIAERGEAYAKWVDYVGAENEELLTDERFQDHYLGHFESMEAYVENLLEECGDYEYLDRLPEHLMPYVKIDVEMMARDYESELHVVEAEEGGVFVFDTRG